MKKLNTQTHNIYETTHEGLHFLVLIDKKKCHTYIYCETNEPNVYYQEDRMWSHDDAVKHAEEHIKACIDVIKYGRERYIEFCKNYTKDDGKIFDYPAITTKEWLLA